MLEEALELATLKAESSFMMQRNLTEEQALATSMEIAKREARMEIYQSFISEERNEDLSAEAVKTNNADVNRHNLVNQDDLVTTTNHNTSHDEFTNPDINQESHQDNLLPTFKQPDRDEDLDQHSFNFGDALCELLKLQGTPDVALDCYDGDPLNYKYFITTFEEVVEKEVTDARGRLMRLIQYTSGEAKELIKGCIHTDASEGYVYAKNYCRRGLVIHIEF